MTSGPSLKELFERYLTEKQYVGRLAVATLKCTRSVFSLFMSLMPEVSYPSDLSVESMTLFFRRIELRDRVYPSGTSRGVKPSTIHTYRSKLNSFFKWMVARGQIENNPVSELKAPSVRYDDNKALSDEEIRKLYSSVTLWASSNLCLRRDTAMLGVLLFTGIRLGEFLLLEVRDLDLAQKIMTIRASTSKSQKTRVIPIHPTLLLHLRDYIKVRNSKGLKTEHLFVSLAGDQGISSHGIKHWVKRLSEKSGVKFHIHRFRHSFACNLARENVNVVKIQKLLGHTTAAMTMMYLRSVETEDLHDDIGKLTI